MNLSMNTYELLTSTLQILKKEQIEILELKTRITKQEFSGGCNCRFVIAEKKNDNPEDRSEESIQNKIQNIK